MSRWLVVAGSVIVVIAGAVVVFRWQRGDGTTRAAIRSTTVVMLGDSITEGGDWETLLPDHAVANRGYAGFTTAELVTVAEEVAEAGPGVVFVLTGTNDIRDGHPATWTVDQLSQVLDLFEHLAPETVVVVQTILPRDDAPQSVIEANEAIRALASQRGLPLLDLYPAFDDGAGGLRDAETVDGIHLAEAGYRLWAGHVVEELQAIGL